MSTFSKRTWERSLKAELGPALTWLLDQLAEDDFRTWADQHLMLDPPTESLTPLAVQKKLGLVVLGRTGKGVFGVPRDSPISPLDVRPIFTAPFNSLDATRVADNLTAYLATDPELEGFREGIIGKGRSLPLAPGAAAPVKASKGKPRSGKLTAKQALSLASLRADEVMRQLGPGVNLVFFLDGVEGAGNVFSVALGLNLPSQTPSSFLEHALVRRVSEAIVSEVSTATGRETIVQPFFEILDTGGPTGRAHVTRLGGLVRRTQDVETQRFLAEVEERLA